MTVYSEANSLHPSNITGYLNKYFVVCLSLSRQMLGQYLKVGYACFAGLYIYLFMVYLELLSVAQTV
jgi:hypothetical protein